VFVLRFDALLTQAQSFWTALVFVNNHLMYRNHGWNELALSAVTTYAVRCFSFFWFFFLTNHVQYICFGFVNSVCLFLLYHISNIIYVWPRFVSRPHRQLVLPGLCFTYNLQSGMSAKVLLHVYCTKYSLDIAYFQRYYQCYSWPLLNEWWWWWWWTY